MKPTSPSPKSCESCSYLVTAPRQATDINKFRSLHSSSLHVTLAEIATNVVDFERESYALAEELKQKDGNRACLPEPIADWNFWLSQSLTVLQTQVKYLEIHARAIQPLVVQSASVKQFQKDLSLATHYESSFCMGLAQAEYRPELLPVAMAS